MWAAGGEGGNPPATGASAGTGALGGSPGAAASQARAAGKGGGKNLRARVPPPLPARSKAEESPALPALLWGTMAARPPPSRPPAIPRSCPAQARRCSVAGGAIDTARDALASGRPLGGRVPPIAAPHTNGRRRRGQSALPYYRCAGWGGAGGRCGAGWGGAVPIKGRGRACGAAMAALGPGCGGRAREESAREPGLGRPGSRRQPRGPAGSPQALCDGRERAGVWRRCLVVVPCALVTLPALGLAVLRVPARFGFLTGCYPFFPLWIGGFYSLAGVPTRVCATFC